MLFLTPACAREAVAGDLWETYRGPRQYAAEALRTVPLVVASQMRRNLNLPALALQVALAHACLGGLAAAVLAPVLMLRDAYQPAARPSHRIALRQAVLIAFSGVVVLQAILGFRPAMDPYLWVELLFIGLLMLPLLCFIRAGLVMDGDRRPALAAETMSEDELTRACLRFSARARRGKRLEAVALVLATIILVLARPGDAGFAALAAIDAAVALYMLMESRGGDCAEPPRLRYQRLLAREQQLRGFLWWLWLAPVMLAVHARLIENGLDAGRPLPLVLGIASAILLCYPLTALNREHGGRIQEQIRMLERIRLPD